MSLSDTWLFANRYLLPHRLMLLARMLERETARDMQAGWNITAAEWRALGYVCMAGSSTAVQICLAFEVDRAEVSRAVHRLVAAKLIRREQARNHDNRLTLTATASGEALHRAAQAKRREYFEWILQDLDPGEREAFDEALGKIAARVAERRAGPAPEAEAAE
jgi:DNA-binding MarR family transcriptional regulator